MVDPNSDPKIPSAFQGFVSSRLVQTSIWLFIIATIGLGFRLVDINRGLWLDELHTSWTVAGGWSEVGPRAESGNQAPVYFFAVKGIVSLIGHSEFSLRLLSVLSGAGLVVGSFFIVQQLTGSRIASLLAAWLVALDPYFVEYSQEARPYAFLQLAGLAQLSLFLKRIEQIDKDQSHRCRKSENWTRFWLVLSIAFCFFIHFTSVLLTASLLVGFIIWNTLKGQSWTRNRLHLMLDFAIGFLLCLPAVKSISAIVSRKGNWELFVNDFSWTPALLHQTWTYLIGAAVCFACWRLLVRTNPNDQESFSIWIVLVAYIGPILFAWISFKTGTAALYHHRYFMIGWIGSILTATTLIGITFQSGRRNGTILAGVVAAYVVVASVGFNPTLWQCVSEGKMPFASRWNDAVTKLNRSAGSNDLVYLFPNLIEDRQLNRESDRSVVETNASQQDRLNQYCLFPINGLYTCDFGQQIARPTLVRPRFGKSDVELMKKHQRVFLLIRGDASIVGDINNEFAEFGIQNQLFIQLLDVEQFEIRGVPQQYISLFEFKVTIEQGPENLQIP